MEAPTPKKKSLLEELMEEMSAANSNNDEDVEVEDYEEAFDEDESYEIETPIFDADEESAFGRYDVKENTRDYTATNAEPYFSYETVKDEEFERTKSVNVSKADDVEEDEERNMFDLRQAVIYQTILQNKYISDWK